MLIIEDITTAECKSIVEEHPEIKENGWKVAIEMEEEMNSNISTDKPFQKIVDENGKCVGLAIISYHPKKLFSKPTTNIFSLDIWDENYDRADVDEAIMRRYPDTNKITMGRRSCQ